MKIFRAPSSHPAAATPCRGSLASLAVLAVLFLGIAGCEPPANKAGNSKPETPVEPRPIEATPNPVPAGTEIGTTKLSLTGDGLLQEVYVSIDGAAEVRCWMGEVKTGSFDFPYIQTGPVYEFRLYRGKEHTDMLGSVKVTRKTN